MSPCSLIVSRNVWPSSRPSRWRGGDDQRALLGLQFGDHVERHLPDGIPAVLALPHEAEGLNLGEGSLVTLRVEILDDVEQLRRVLLPVNLAEPGAPQRLGVDHHLERVAPLHGAVLPGVAANHQPGTVIPGKAQQPRHARVVQQARLVHPHHPAFGQVLQLRLVLEIGDGGRPRHAGFFEPLDRAGRGRQHHRFLAGQRPDGVCRFAYDRRFSHACLSDDAGKQIPGGKDVPDGGRQPGVPSDLFALNLPGAGVKSQIICERELAICEWGPPVGHAPLKRQEIASGWAIGSYKSAKTLWQSTSGSSAVTKLRCRGSGRQL